MTFVDDDERHLQSVEPLFEAFTSHTLGGDIEELVFPKEAIVQCRLYLLLRHPRVNRRSAYATSSQMIHLVLHQRDEWRDDDRKSWEEKPWYLEGNTLAPTSRH